PAVTKMKEIIDNGELGEIYYLYAQRVNLGKVRSNENALWSFAPHDISVVLHLFNAVPDRVTANGVCYLQKDIQDVVFATLYFPDNRMAHIHLSWLDPHKERKITLVGSKKMAVFDDMSSSEKIRIYDKGANLSGEILSYQEAITLRNGDIYIPRIDMKEPLSIECAHFIDCIKNNKKPETDGKNGLEVVKVLEAAQRSLETGGHPVKLEEI
ncbi:MAG: Gfo/Idh/MocA family oxidoreductase, partial [Candidatus Theseobacter exili]|nr:Gfo/Idh/MocA family oxidoreductase [Candidatus Theseobacter exili]